MSAGHRSRGALGPSATLRCRSAGARRTEPRLGLEQGSSSREVVHTLDRQSIIEGITTATLVGLNAGNARPRAPALPAFSESTGFVHRGISTEPPNRGSLRT